MTSRGNLTCLISKNIWYRVLWYNTHGFSFYNDKNQLMIGRFKSCVLIDDDWIVNDN
jgi:hypothetical protein